MRQHPSLPDSSSASSRWAASERLTVALIAFVVGSIGCGYASSDYRRARFAYAFASESTILAAHENPGDSERPNVVVFVVAVQSWPDPDSWAGRRLGLRHRTAEPEFFADAYVDVNERQVACIAHFAGLHDRHRR